MGKVYIRDEAGVLGRAALKEETSYVCGTCGALVHFDSPQIFRLNGRLYVGAICPHCGSFVGNVFTSEMRPIVLVPPEEAEEVARKLDLEPPSEAELFTVNVAGKRKQVYAIERLNPAKQDYIAFLGRVGRVWKDGEFSELCIPKKGVRKAQLDEPIPEWGWKWSVR